MDKLEIQVNQLLSLLNSELTLRTKSLASSLLATLNCYRRRNRDSISTLELIKRINQAQIWLFDNEKEKETKTEVAEPICSSDAETLQAGASQK